MAEGILALCIALALLLVAFFVWWDTKTVRKESGLPRGEIIYADAPQWQENHESLYAAELGLVGKPDYLVQAPDGTIVPVELKSGLSPPAPYFSHQMQLAAYCLLVEENYGIRPNFGIIQYSNQAFEVDYTPELEAELLDILSEMQEDLFEDDVDRSHEQPSLCRACSVREHCELRLA